MFEDMIEVIGGHPWLIAGSVAILLVGKNGMRAMFKQGVRAGMALQEEWKDLLAEVDEIGKTQKTSQKKTQTHHTAADQHGHQRAVSSTLG